MRVKEGGGGASKSSQCKSNTSMVYQIWACKPAFSFLYSLYLMSHLYNPVTPRHIKPCYSVPLDFPLFLLSPATLAPSAQPPKGGSLMKQGSSWATQPLRPTDGSRVWGQGFMRCPVKAAGLQNTSRQDRDIMKACTFHSRARERLLEERDADV